MSHLTISRLITVLVIVSAVIAPAASARPADNLPVTSPRQVQQPPANPVAAESAPSSATPFAWGDAALGAAGMLIVLSVGAAGVVTVRRSRARSHTLVAG
jgi:hypothetical protein